MPKPPKPSKPERGKQLDKDSEEAEVLAELAEHKASPDPTGEATGPTNILLAIQNMSKTMTDRFDILEATLASTQASLLSLGNRVKEVEDATSSFDSRLSNLGQACTKMRAENEALCSKVIDLEARSRRQNIKIVGLAEKIENGRPSEFLTEFLPELLGASNFSKPIVVDRAHRLGRQPSDGNDRPRIMIARIHHYQIKEKILQLAHQQSPLNYRGKAIHIFPDFPAEVMKQRQAFAEAQGCWCEDWLHLPGTAPGYPE